MATFRRPGTSAKGDWQIVIAGYLEAMGEQ